MGLITHKDSGILLTEGSLKPQNPRTLQPYKFCHASPLGQSCQTPGWTTESVAYDTGGLGFRVQGSGFRVGVRTSLSRA